MEALKSPSWTFSPLSHEWHHSWPEDRVLLLYRKRKWMNTDRDSDKYIFRMLLRKKVDDKVGDLWDDREINGRLETTV